MTRTRFTRLVIVIGGVALACVSLAIRLKVTAGESPGVHVAQGVLQQVDTLCGRAFMAPPTIDETGIGVIKLGTSIDDVRHACPEARDTTEGEHQEAVLVFRGFGGRIVIFADSERPDGTASGPVRAIRVEGAALATARGIRPGSTLGALRAAYGQPRLGMCDAHRVAGAEVRPAPWLYFVFDSCADTFSSGSATVPDSLRILAVVVFIPVD